MSCDCGCCRGAGVRRGALLLRERKGDVGEDDQF